MKSISKILLMILLVCFIAAFAVGCGSENGEQATEAEGESSENLNDQGERTYMALNGDTKIFCTRKWSPEVVDWCEKIAEAIKSKTGLELGICYESDGSGSEITVGYVDGHSATRAAYENITVDQYAVSVNESSAVIAAYSKKNMNTAVDVFVEQSIVKCDGEWTIASIAPSGNDKKKATALSSYRIVYAAEADDYIVNEVVPTIQKTVFDQTKINVEAVSDAEPAVPNEIVIGHTNRSTDQVKRYFGVGTEYASYGAAVIPDGNKIFVLGGDRAAMSVSVLKFKSFILAADYGPKLLNIDTGMYMSDIMTTTNPRELAEGADIRIMSYNILNPAWGNEKNAELNKVESRSESFLKLVLYYRPDVIGLQETSTEWHAFLDKALVYTGVYAKCCENTDTTYNMTGFLYNPDTLKVVDSYVIDVVPKSEIRVVSVAVFERLEGGERFVVMNTHPAPQSQESYGAHMKKITEIESAEMEKYKDLPVFLTGDFNTRENQKEYSDFLAALGVKNVKYEADQLLHDCAGNNFKTPVENNGSRCIDHIFINENVDAKLYSAVIHDGIERGSDHIPIYADVALKGASRVDL